MKRIVACFLFSIMVLCITARAWAELPVLGLSPEQQRYGLGPWLEVLEDRAGKYTIDQVSAPPLTSQFRPLKKKSFDVGLSDSVWWLRFNLSASPGPGEGLEIGSAWLLDLGISFGWLDARLFTSPEAAGRDMEKSRRYALIGVIDTTSKPPPDGWGHYFCFELPPLSQSPQTFYLRIHGKRWMHFPMEIASKPAVLEKRRQNTLFGGLFGGLLLGVIIISLIMFILFPDPTYIFFVLFLLLFGLYSMSQTNGLYSVLMPGLTCRKVSFLLLTLVLLGHVMRLLFTMQYFQTAIRLPLWHKVFGFIIFLEILNILLIPFISFGALVRLLMIISTFFHTPAFVAVILLSWWRGFSPAKYILFGYLSTNIGKLLFYSAFIGFMPDYSVYGEYALEIGILLEALFFSRGLYDRLQGLRLDKEKAERQTEKALEKARELNERLQEHSRQLEREIDVRKNTERELERHKHDLEGLVAERTGELSEKNQALSEEVQRRQKVETDLRLLNEELEDRVKIRTGELENMNQAMKALLELREEEQTEMAENVSSTLQKLVFPTLERLREYPEYTAYMEYLDILETNLKEVAAQYTRTLTSASVNLTPMEMQVANFIREGKSTKQIAELLHLSENTVSTHRRNIRDKLGIKHSQVNLQTFLASLK